jgi:hypothetical protein
MNTEQALALSRLSLYSKRCAPSSALPGSDSMCWLPLIWLFSFHVWDATQGKSHHSLQAIGCVNGSGQLPDDRCPEWRA